jgi:large subunit ribosomal protein L20
MRAKNRVASRRRRKKYLSEAKGYFGRKKNVYTVAKNQVEKSWQYAYTGRKLKKREYRALWIQRINAGVRQHDLSYSQFMNLLKKSDVEMNRKVLADLAMNNPEAFAKVVEQVKKAA